MSITSLLPVPKHWKSNSEKQVSLEQKSKELVVKTLAHQDEQDMGRSVFDSAIASDLKFQDFVPIRQNNFNLELPKPSLEEIDKCYQRTKQIFDRILLKNTQPESAVAKSSQQAHANAYEIKVSGPGIRNPRTLIVTEHARDPLQPNTIKAKKVVAPPVEEPITPIFNKTDSVETSKKLSKEERDMWKIPPAISSWKNPNGYTIGLDKRLAMDGRYSKDQMQAHEINDGFEKLSTALEDADRRARQALKLKAEAKRQIAVEENKEKEEKLRLLAQKAREERSRQKNKRNYQSLQDRPSEDISETNREAVRNSRRQDLERDMKRSKMSTADRLRELAYSQGRDISEKVILGAAKATETPGVNYDSRLFSKGGNAEAKRSEGQLYDSPLFSQQATSYRANISKIDNLVEEESFLITGQSEPIEFTAASDEEHDTKDRDHELAVNDS